MNPRLILFGGAAAIVLAAAAGLYWKGRNDDAAIQKPRIEAAADNGAARTLEAGGERQSAARTEALARQARKLQESTDALRDTIRSEATLAVPLAPDRAARLRAHDDVLCHEAPVCRGPAPAESGDPARRGGVL